MKGSGHPLSAPLTAGAFLHAGLCLLHSLRTRGPRRTALFLLLGLALPASAEVAAVGPFGWLRHRVAPRVAGVPLAVAAGWYAVIYASFAMVEGLGAGRKAPLLAALAATDLDLLLDPCGLDVGLWEWTRGGPYAREVVGANGLRGIPLVNYLGWLALVFGVTAVYGRLVGGRSGAKDPRGAALLLLPFYLPPAAWALRRGRLKYLVRSAPFAIVLLLAIARRGG